MAQYSGSIDLIGGLRQKNNGTFPLIDANAVQVSDNTDDDVRLDQVLKDLKLTAGDGIAIKDGVISLDLANGDTIQY